MDVDDADLKLFKLSTERVQEAVAKTHRFLYGGDRHVADDSLPANAFEQVAGLAVYLHEIGAMGKDLASAVIEAVDRYKSRLLIEYKTVEARDAFYINVIENETTHRSPPGSPLRANRMSYSPHKRKSDASSPDNDGRYAKMANGTTTDAVLYNPLKCNSMSTGAWWDSLPSILPSFRNAPENITARLSFAETEAKLRNNNGEPTITRELFDKYVKFVYSDFMPTMGVAMAGAWLIGQQAFLPHWTLVSASAYTWLRTITQLDTHYGPTVSSALHAARMTSIVSIGPKIGQFLLVRNKIAKASNYMRWFLPVQALPTKVTESLARVSIALGNSHSLSGSALGDKDTYEAFRMFTNTAPMRNISAMLDVAIGSPVMYTCLCTMGMTALHFGGNYNATMYDKQRITTWVGYNSVINARSWLRDCIKSVGYAGTSPEFDSRPGELVNELHYKVTERDRIIWRLNNAFNKRRLIVNDSSKRQVAGIDQFIITMQMIESDICALLKKEPSERDPAQKVDCPIGSNVDSNVVDQVFTNMQKLSIRNRTPRVLM